MDALPAPAHRVSEEALDGYLDQARAILASRVGTAAGSGQVSPAFDRLRWFDLPGDCLILG